MPIYTLSSEKMERDASNAFKKMIKFGKPEEAARLIHDIKTKKAEVSEALRNGAGAEIRYANNPYCFTFGKTHIATIETLVPPNSPVASRGH